MGSGQHGFGLLFLDTGTAERKGEFLATAHGQDGVEQTSRGKNVHRGDTKIRPQGLIDGLRDDLRMTNRVRAVLVHPRVQGGHIHIAYLFTLPSHSMQGHRACSAPKEGLVGVPRARQDRMNEDTETRPARCLPGGPTHTPTFR